MVMMMASGPRLGCLALLLVFAAGCDKVPLMAPTSSTINVTSDLLVLPTGGSVQVTASVAESSGTPVQNGTTVRFSTTLGRVDPVEAQTRNGLAVTTFFAGESSGTAEVRAVSGGATGTGGGTTGTPATTATNAVQIQIGAAAATAVTLSASSSTVPAAGGMIAILASVLDGSGNSMRGIQVSFSTTAGSLSSSSTTTNESGQASIELTTNRTATVTARVGSGESARTASLTINAAAANAISLSLAAPAVAVGQPVTLTVTPTVGANNTAPRVVVDWGDGTTSDLGIVAAARTASHIYAGTGVFTISATGTAEGEVTTASIPVTVNAQAALNARLTVSATPTKCSPVTFTAEHTVDTTASIRSYEWRIDGTTITTTGNILNRVFTTTGLKTIDVTLTTTDGRTGSAQTQINVVESTPPSLTCS
jgi:adhesin/invasin